MGDVRRSTECRVQTSPLRYHGREEHEYCLISNHEEYHCHQGYQQLLEPKMEMLMFGTES